MTQTKIFAAEMSCTAKTEPALKPTITVTPATRRSMQNAAQLKTQTNIRVAAYCRVSTSAEGQQTSYTRQKSFYSTLISEHPGWTLAGIYADADASGTNTDHRLNFQRMIEDCKNGKIDYIITKSISRFARNTVDTLNYVRMLKQLSPAIGIYFEKENVDTLNATGELLLTILSALAQDESRSISDNVRWSYAKKFQSGIAHCNLKGMMGYDKGENGQWLINEQQAEIVRLIYDLYLAGNSASKIARELNSQGIKTLFGRQWEASAIMRMLRNEKYAGDCELQKTIVKDFLTHYSYKNLGEAPKYYVRNHHAPIIPREKWDKVQMMIAGLDGTRRRGCPGHEEAQKKRAVPVKGRTFYNLCCGEEVNGHICSRPFYRNVYNRSISGYSDERSLKSEALRTGIDLSGKMNEIYKYTFAVWRCAGRFGEKKGNKMIRSGNHSCTAPVLYEIALEQSFMEMLYRLKRNYESAGKQSELIKSCEQSLDYSASEHHIDIKTNFELFLPCILKLPEQNPAGMNINVFGLDCQDTPLRNADGTLKASVYKSLKHSGPPPEPEHIAHAPDLLPFDRGIYTAFVEKATVYGDTIEYQMTFGGRLKSSGNQRKLEHFQGYRSFPDGQAQLFLDTWQVTKGGIRYRRMKKK